jgi:hypothetical protein
MSAGLMLMPIQTCLICTFKTWCRAILANLLASWRELRPFRTRGISSVLQFYQDKLLNYFPSVSILIDLTLFKNVYIRIFRHVLVDSRFKRKEYGESTTLRYTSRWVAPQCHLHEFGMPGQQACGRSVSVPRMWQVAGHALLSCGHDAETTGDKKQGAS